MMRELYTILVFTFILILCEPQTGYSEFHLHDVTQEAEKGSLPEINVSMKKNYVQKNKRDASQEKSENLDPVKITPFYSLSEYLLQEEKLALQNVLERAISKIKSLLSVIHKVDGPLLLKRKDACPIVWKRGINKGKCSRIKKGYTGEYCLDNFKIPSDHLKGFAIYNKTNPDPVKVYKTDGPGVEDTDFILYVTSKTTVLCNPHKSSAIAYAAACQLDNHGRPTAGQVNFCPRILKAQKFDEELMYKTAIHELFHALGFSNKLFEKFISCDKDGECRPRPQPVVESASGVMMLDTPAVVREMRRHFGCVTESDFGGPLYSVAGRVSSHWDPILMHSSIMTAKEQKPYSTLIDRITLAVFEDSGWYNVDYSQADPFVWGKGRGCQFITEKACNEQDGFCHGNITGCHYLGLSKAKCTAKTKSDQSKCGVYAADQKPCFVETLSASSTSGGETFSPDSRCFLSSLVPIRYSDSENAQISNQSNQVEMRGRCYESKCKANKVYVRVEKTRPWSSCPFGTRLQYGGFHGFLRCPHPSGICASFEIKPSPIPPTLTYSDHSVNKMENPEEEKTKRKLYVDIRMTEALSDHEKIVLQSALLSVLKENEVLFDGFFVSSSSRYCMTVELGEDNTLERSTLRKYFVKAISDAFSGKYNRTSAISVQANSTHFCKQEVIGKRPYRPIGNSARGHLTLSTLAKVVIIGLLLSFVNLVLMLSDL